MVDMIYSFNETMFHQFWNRYPEVMWHPYRMEYWKQEVEPTWNLKYHEDDYDGGEYFWGAIEGTEKQITWFLLHL